MRKFKALLALLLLGALVIGLFTACGNSEQPGDTSMDGNGGEIVDPGEDEEITTIQYVFYDFSSTGSDHGERIAEAVNAITEPQIGVHVEFDFVQPGDWKSRITMAMAGGETIDLMQISPPIISLSSLYGSNQVMDLTELLPEYAPDAYSLMQKYLGNFTFDGKIYGVPANRGLCTNQYILMRKDMLEELGLLEFAENMTTWSEYEQIMQAVTDAYAGQGIYANTNGMGIVDGIYGDNFSDSVKSLVTDTLTVTLLTEDGQFELKQASEGYHNLIQKMADWADRNFIYPDALYATVIQDDLFKQNVAFSGPQSAEYGVAATKSASFGVEVIATQVLPGTITGATWGLAVPVTAEEPEAALRFVNLCYTSSELMNLMIRGQEGIDYTLEDGQCVMNEGAYQQTATFFGNELITTPLYGNGADFYQTVGEINDSAAVSPYLGFSLDTSELDLMVSQISAVMDQYRLTMECGGYTEDGYQAFLRDLESAGVYDYLDELQAQLDAWVAAN